MVVQQYYGGLQIRCDYTYSTWIPIISGPLGSYGRKNSFDNQIYDLGTPMPSYSGRYTCRYGNEQHSIDIQVRGEYTKYFVLFNAFIINYANRITETV